MTEGSVPIITPQEAKAKLDAGEAATIDVRLPYTWAGDRIQGSINLPNLAIQFRQAEVPAGKELIFYGANTAKAEAAAKKAIDLGYDKVAVIDGGFDAWLDAGLPSESITGTAASG
jgi:rhodanese-related sulfurtransferase